MAAVAAADTDAGCPKCGDLGPPFSVVFMNIESERDREEGG
jgi:hypothetical protein